MIIKNQMRPLSFMLLLLAFFFSSAEQMAGQKKVNISGGIGFAETLNIGMRYQVFNKSQIGLSVGTWPSPNDWLFDWKSLISLSGDFFYHLGDSSEFSNLPPWFIRIGLDDIIIDWDDEGSLIDHNLEFHLRFGRDFYFIEDLGVSLDAGVAFFVINKTGFTSVLPSLGLSLFFQF